MKLTLTEFRHFYNDVCREAMAALKELHDVDPMPDFEEMYIVAVLQNSVQFGWRNDDDATFQIFINDIFVPDFRERNIEYRKEKKISSLTYERLADLLAKEQRLAALEGNSDGR